MDQPIPQDFRSSAILCLRSPYDEQAAQEVRACLSDPSFDWPGFARFTNRERISPLLHYHLENLELLPAEFANSMHRAYLENAWVNALRLEELERLCRAFEAAQIPLVLLKGAALMVSQYEKMALRPMLDMDLLVPVEHFDKAKQVLFSKNYNQGVSISTWLSTDIVNEAPFEREGEFRWRIDLHSSLLAVPYLLSSDQMDWFWNHTVSIEKKGIKIRILNSESLLLHLCFHLLHHNYSSGTDLLRLNDIYQLICTTQINWQEVLEVGKSFKLLLPLQKVLHDLAENWSAPIPADVFEMFAQMQPSQQEKRKFGEHFWDQQNNPFAFFNNVMSFPDWYRRIRYALAVVFPPQQYIKDRYGVRNPLFIPFYYFYRLVNSANRQAGSWSGIRPKRN